MPLQHLAFPVVTAYAGHQRFNHPRNAEENILRAKPNSWKAPCRVVFFRPLSQVTAAFFFAIGSALGAALAMGRRPHSAAQDEKTRLARLAGSEPPAHKGGAPRCSHQESRPQCALLFPCFQRVSPTSASNARSLSFPMWSAWNQHAKLLAAFDIAEARNLTCATFRANTTQLRQKPATNSAEQQTPRTGFDAQCASSGC